MDEYKEKYLFEKYPKLFCQKDLPMSKTCMCWGIECGNGWFYLIDYLCSCLQNLTDKFGHPQVEVVQIKEKIGELRFYVDGASEQQHTIIDVIEDLSNCVCEECGQMGAKQTNSGWVKTLCDKCKK